MGDRPLPYCMECVVYRGRRRLRWEVFETLQAQGYCRSLAELAVRAMPAIDASPEAPDLGEWLRSLGLEEAL